MTSNPTEATRDGVVRRFAPGWVEGSDSIYMHQISNGTYVLYSDYDALRSEVSRLREALDDLLNTHAKPSGEVDV